MKRFFVLGIICSILTGADAYSAGARTPTAGARGRTPVATQNASSGATAVATRGRTGARAASNQVSGAKNVSGGTAVLPGQNTNTAVAPKSSGVSARAATKQKVVNSGTKIAGATENTVVSEECKNKYYGCMDSFCMLDNTNGGRCLCSNRNAELETVLSEIQKLDEQSYAMATAGVEVINMGDSADDVNAMAEKAVKKLTSADDEAKKQKARKLNLDTWNIVDDDSDDVFSVEEKQNDLANKTGDSLHTAVANMCASQIPECSSSMNMLKMMYAQQIKSDCSAYENSLKKQKQDSTKKLATAQQAMREAALEQYQNQNKYDLGQCTIRFKQCMQTTAGCGDDFSKCASMVATTNATSKYSAKRKNQQYTISGTTSNITISSATYDTLMAKKPMCDTVTKQCVAVKNQVWDTFLREVAPELKSAELIAESDLRMSCIGNISECFQKACKDTMDPNDPDGSYDMCLTRPETLKSLCRVQLEPCETAEPKIFDYVKARLASMRVDSCTKEVKSCFESEDRCGKDYSKCIGLDLMSIKQLCPLEKLVGCQQNGEDATWETIDNVVQGIYLNADNALLTQCVNVVNAKMAEICGGSDTCYAFDDDKSMGTESLLMQKQNDGSFVIEGLVSFYNVKVKEIDKDNQDADNIKFGKYELDINDYASNITGAGSASAAKQRVLSTLGSVQNKINQKIALLTSDPKVSMCVYGRDMKQIRGRGEVKNRYGSDNNTDEDSTQARFPNLLDSSITAIINSGLDQASKNYSKKFNELLAKVTEQQNDEVKAAMCAAMASNGKSTKCKKQGFLKNHTVCEEYDVSIDTAINKELGASGTGYELKMTLGGIANEQLLKAQYSGKSDYTQTDPQSGSAIGTVRMAAVYSPDTNVCTLTTTTTMCENMAAVVTTDDVNDKSNEWASAFNPVLGAGVGGSRHNIHSITENYHGTMCEKMAKPIVNTQEIAM